MWRNNYLRGFLPHLFNLILSIALIAFAQQVIASPPKPDLLRSNSNNLPIKAIHKPLLSKAEHLRVVVLSAAQFATLQSKLSTDWRVADLSLSVIQAGQLQPIAFQIDEINREGFPYTESMGIAHSGVPQQFDGRDELLFMLQDASSERWPAALARGPEWLAEIEIFTQAGSVYVYLQKQSTDNHLPAVAKRYIHYDAKKYSAETPYYSLASNSKNPLELTDMQFFAFKDRSKTTLLDTLKMRIQGQWIGADNGLTITNRNFHAQVVQVTQGPIRASVQMKTTLSLAKLPVMNLWIMYQFDAAHLRAVSRSRTPSWVPIFVDNAAVSISVDANQLLGSEVYALDANQALGLVDGRLSLTEMNLSQQLLKPAQAWWMLKSPNNFQVLATLTLPENQPSVQKLIYQDDARLKVDPERFPGQWPNVGFRIEQVPLDKLYTMVFDLYVDESQPAYDLPAYAEKMRQPLKVIIR